jgi:hypothetical protein
MEDKELFELCQQVYEETGWDDKSLINSYKQLIKHNTTSWNNWFFADYNNHVNDFSERSIPLYTLEYLLEKLPPEIDGKLLVITNGDKPHTGYAERDNYGNYTLDESFYENAQYSDTTLKALLKLTLVLSERGEL